MSDNPMCEYGHPISDWMDAYCLMCIALGMEDVPPQFKEYPVEFERIEREAAELRAKLETLPSAPPLCPSCRHEPMERQWVCEHCGHRDAIPDGTSHRAEQP